MLGDKVTMYIGRIGLELEALGEVRCCPGRGRSRNLADHRGRRGRLGFLDCDEVVIRLGAQEVCFHSLRVLHYAGKGNWLDCQYAQTFCHTQGRCFAMSQRRAAIASPSSSWALSARCLD